MRNYTITSPCLTFFKEVQEGDNYSVHHWGLSLSKKVNNRYMLYRSECFFTRVQRENQPLLLAEFLLQERLEVYPFV